MKLQQLQTDPASAAILAARAQALAGQVAQSSQTVGEAFVVFRLGTGGYTLPAGAIREVQPLGRCTPLPSTPSCMLGLVNLRGRPLAVLDIRPLLGLPVAPLPADAWLLIVAAGGIEVGLAADSVLGVQHIADALTPAFSAVAGRCLAWVRGVDQELRLQLDPAGLLADARLTGGAGG